LQFGRNVVLTDLRNDHWQLDLIKRDVAVSAGLALPDGTQVWSAGHAQWFARPPDGPAMRLGARCASPEDPGA
jgi:hypothetical protein